MPTNPNAPENLYPGYLSSGSVGTSNDYTTNPELAQRILPDSSPVIPSTISSRQLASTPNANFQAPQPPDFYPVAGIKPPELQATAPEQKANGLSADMQKLNDFIAGKAADTNALYKQQGFNTTTDANGNIVGDPGTADLTAKLTALQNEAQAIPLQLQQDATGRGITAGGLAPVQTAALRNNSIQALGVSSLIAAKNGQLTTAEHYVNAALTQKYGPAEAALKAKAANLDLILKSPDYSLADKNRAQAQQSTLAQQAAQLEKSKQDTKDAQTAVVSIIGSNPGITTDVMQQLQQATDPIAVAEIAAKNGLTVGTDKLPASAQEYLFAVKNGYKGTYTAYQNEDANRKQAIAAAGVTTPGAPTSYKEWELAGKPGTYAEYLANSNIKAPTAAQQTVSTYAARIEQANPTIDNLTSYVAGLNPIQFEAMSRMPSYLQSANFQQYDQAARNFINATLRRESGAVISPSEFDNAYKQYLPRAGDTPTTLAEKKKNRDIVFASLRRAAGNAYQSVDELLGTGTPTGPLKSGYKGTTTSGIEYTIQ